MRLGLALPHYDFSVPGHTSASFRTVAERARWAEGLGFDSVWISDHFFLSLERYGGDDRRHGSLEPLTTLAGLAAVTSRVRLGTLVLSAPFRHPASVAKAAAAIDLASGGRLDLGIGGGWFADEFERFGYELEPAVERFARLEEYLEVLGLLLDEGPADHSGRRYRLQGAFNHPAPAQRPRPPVWLGAKGGPRALRIAARLADGWNTVWRWTVQDYAARVQATRQACEQEGRDPVSLRRSIGLYTIVGEDTGDLARRFDAMAEWAPRGAITDDSPEAFASGTLTGTPDRILERLAEFAQLGVEEMIVSPAPVPFSLPDPTMVELLAESVIPAARSL